MHASPNRRFVDVPSAFTMTAATRGPSPACP